MEGIEVEGSKRITVIPEGEIGNERPIEMVTENGIRLNSKFMSWPNIQIRDSVKLPIVD